MNLQIYFRGVHRDSPILLLRSAELCSVNALDISSINL